MRLQIGDKVNFEKQEGTIEYIGKLKNEIGEWIGIRLNTAEGKNDGSKDGIHYFDCGGLNKGIFVRPEMLLKSKPNIRDVQAKYERLKMYLRAQELTHEEKINEFKYKYLAMKRGKEEENVALRKKNMNIVESVLKLRDNILSLGRKVIGLEDCINTIADNIKDIGNRKNSKTEVDLDLVDIVETLLHKIEQNLDYTDEYRKFKGYIDV